MKNSDNLSQQNQQVTTNNLEVELVYPDVKVISSSEWDRILQIVNDPAKPGQKLIDLMSREPGYKREF